MAIALSLIYLKNDNLIYSIASHALYNTLVLVNYFTGWGNPYLFLLIFVISLIVTKKATKKVKQIKN